MGKNSKFLPMCGIEKKTNFLVNSSLMGTNVSFALNSCTYVDILKRVHARNMLKNDEIGGVGEN